MPNDFKKPTTFAGQVLLADELVLHLMVSSLAQTAPGFAQEFLSGLDQLLAGDVPSTTRQILVDFRGYVA